MFPSRFPFKGVPGRGAEAQFYRACETQLDDTWLALYNVYWSGPTEKRNEDSDADFVLLHPEHGIFVVEVKGGEEIFVEENRWYSIPHGKRVPKSIKNPFTQSSQAKRFLWNYIRERVPKAIIDGPFGHFVVFPGHKQEGDLSPQARRDLIIDREDLRDLQGSMVRIGKYFNQAHKLDHNIVREIKDLLVPSFEIVGSRNDEILAAADKMIFLTEVQVRAFGMLQESSHLTVIGGAGTGKTILAIHKAKELAIRGYKVLFLTGAIESLTNPNLNSDLVESYPNITVHDEKTFLKFVGDRWREIRLARLTKSGYSEEEILISDDIWILPEEVQTNRFSKQKIAEPELSWEESAAEVAVSLSEDTTLFYDALIVDEGQIVPKYIYDGCSMFLRPNAPEYVFGDPYQNVEPVFISNSLLESLNSQNLVELNVNCRSTIEIARFANQILGLETDEFGISGEPIRAVFTENEGLAEVIKTIVEEWHRSFGLDFKDIHLIWVGDFAHFEPFEEHFWDFHAFAVELPLNDSRDAVEASYSKWKQNLDELERNLDSYVQGSISFETFINLKEALDLDLPLYHEDQDRDRLLEELQSRNIDVLSAEKANKVIGLQFPGVIVIDTGRSGGKKSENEMYVAASRAQFLLAYVGHPTAPFSRVLWLCKKCGETNTYTSWHENKIRTRCSSCDLVQDVIPSEDADDIQVCWEL